MQSTIRVGEFQFDAASGELTHAESPDSDVIVRLPPQPAQLFSLLIDNYPEIVTRTQIQQELWPGVTGDFDSNLHFCIRQVRSALGDSANDPSYIQTVPRRGYRLIAVIDREGASASDVSAIESPARVAPERTVERVPSQPEKPDVSDKFSIAAKPAFRWMIPLAAWLLGAVVLATTIAFIATSLLNQQSSQPTVEMKSEPASTRLPRIAIMPFQADEPGFGSLGTGQIADDLLQALADRFHTLDVIGPATTQQYSTGTTQMRQVIQNVQPDLIINGRFVKSDDQLRMLGEIIRAEDGAHIWVHSFDPNDAVPEIVAQIADEIIQRVEPDLATSVSNSGAPRKPK